MIISTSFDQLLLTSLTHHHPLLSSFTHHTHHHPSPLITPSSHQVPPSLCYYLIFTTLQYFISQLRLNMYSHISCFIHLFFNVSLFILFCIFFFTGGEGRKKEEEVMVFIFKVVLVGDGDSGKTALIRRYIVCIEPLSSLFPLLYFFLPFACPSLPSLCYLSDDI